MAIYMLETKYACIHKNRKQGFSIKYGNFACIKSYRKAPFPTQKTILTKESAYYCVFILPVDWLVSEQLRLV